MVGTADDFSFLSVEPIVYATLTQHW